MNSKLKNLCEIAGESKWSYKVFRIYICGISAVHAQWYRAECSDYDMFLNAENCNIYFSVCNFLLLQIIDIN